MDLVGSGDRGGRATSPHSSPRWRMEVSRDNLKIQQSCCFDKNTNMGYGVRCEC